MLLWAPSLWQIMYMHGRTPRSALWIPSLQAKSLRQTVTQLLRLLGNTPLQVEADFIYTESYLPQHTSMDYLGEFYGTFAEVRNRKYDGFLMTGAPIEQMPKVNIHAYSLPAGRHTLRLPKGILIVAGFTADAICPRDCALNGPSTEVDWLFQK